MLRIITNDNYIAHSEPICKQLGLIKVPDMYRIAIWKFYYKLMNNVLPPYFSIMKPTLPRICDHYGIRRPTFHLPIIHHEYAEHLLEYQITKVLNDPGSIIYTLKVQTHSFKGLKKYLKITFLDSYSDECLVHNCEACRRMHET